MSACRVCGRQLEETVDHEPMPCVCATRHAAPPPPAPWSWVTKEEADALRAALHVVRRPGSIAEILAHKRPAHSAGGLLANVVEELLVELPRRRLQVPMSPLGDPPCVCECGAQFAYIEGLTESRACCVFCSQRKRRARLAADGDRARNEGEEALRRREEPPG